MVARLTDSEQYAHLWGTEELRAVFEERRRLQSWLDILVALAAAQAELGIIPADAAAAIASAASVDRLDLGFVAAETRRTSHSTLGLIRGLQRVLPPEAGEHIYYGGTVQDVTDTWTALAMRSVGEVVGRDLDRIRALLVELADRHRDTVMVGRTHGQPGAPVTFGLKAASWADEVDRHLARLRQGAPRWLVGQLGGAVGTLAFFGDQGLELRARFCARLGLADPGISWLTARDRLAEFGNLLAMVAATLARIGNEVYELQRPEIGELHEAVGPEVVGSITMPHKRNPEGRAPGDARPARAGAGRRCCWRAWSPSTSATGAPGRWSGPRSRRSACSPGPPSPSPAGCWPASRWTPRRWPGTWPRAAATPPPSGSWPRSRRRSASTAPRRCSRRPWAGRGQPPEPRGDAAGQPRAAGPAGRGRVRSLLAGADTGSAGAMVDEVVGRLRAGPS